MLEFKKKIEFFKYPLDQMIHLNVIKWRRGQTGLFSHWCSSIIWHFPIFI